MPMRMHVIGLLFGVPKLGQGSATKDRVETQTRRRSVLVTDAHYYQSVP
jgi:hypothetical protein